MSDQDTSLPPPLRGLPTEQINSLRQYFLQAHNCIRCNLNQGQPSIAPSEEDKETFLRSILGRAPFRKTYKLYGGKLTMDMSSLTGLQSRRLMLLNRQLSTDNPYNHSIDQIHLKLLFYVVKVDKTEFTPPMECETAEEALSTEYEKRFGAFNEGLLALTVRSMLEFARLEDTLIQGGMDQAFWKGAGLA